MDIFGDLFGALYGFLNEVVGHQFANWINGLLYSLGVFGF